MCRRAGISTLMSIYGLRPYFFRRKMEKTRPMREEMDGKVIISRHSRHFFIVNSTFKVLLPICTSTWRLNSYVSRQGKGINRRNESTIIMMINILDFGTVEVIFVAFHFNCCLF